MSSKQISDYEIKQIVDRRMAQESKRKNGRAIVRNRVDQVEKNTSNQSNRTIAREYWNLGLFFLERKKYKKALEYLDASIYFKENSEHSCILHHLGEYNKILDRIQRMKRNGRNN